MMEAGAVPEAKMTDEFECKEILEWSRHYDNQLWFVTSLLTGANAVLMTIPSNSLRVGLLGMALAVVTVFFATSFRSLRRGLYCRLKNRHCSLIYLVKGDKRLPQWPVYVFFFALVVGYWFWLLWANCPDHRCISASALVFSLLLLLVLHSLGRSRSGSSSAKN